MVLPVVDGKPIRRRGKCLDQGGGVMGGGGPGVSGRCGGEKKVELR